MEIFQWDMLSSDHVKSKLLAGWSKVNFPAHYLDEVIMLYRDFLDDLRSVKRRQSSLVSLASSIGLTPQLCDLEAEITYLRIRKYKPKVVVEISPASGWSTSWILHALKDNGEGVLHSYDLVDDSLRIIPKELSDGRWVFHQGDIREQKDILPLDVDYLFMDSDHSAQFGEWYIENLFPLFKKGTKVSVHDIVKLPHEPGYGLESEVLMHWLAKKNIDCFTASRLLPEKGYNTVALTRVKCQLSNLISSNYNSMIYFSL